MAYQVAIELSTFLVLRLGKATYFDPSQYPGKESETAPAPNVRSPTRSSYTTVYIQRV